MVVDPHNRKYASEMCLKGYTVTLALQQSHVIQLQQPKVFVTCSELSKADAQEAALHAALPCQHPAIAFLAATCMLHVDAASAMLQRSSHRVSIAVISLEQWHVPRMRHIQGCIRLCCLTVHTLDCHSQHCVKCADVNVVRQLSEQACRLWEANALLCVCMPHEATCVASWL